MPQQDELWQADITYLEYNGKDVNQLTFIDVYSRFVVFANKELLNEMEESDDFKELEMITLNACQYYNSNRYHKSLQYMTPYEWYRGNPEKIAYERKIKLEEARRKRKEYNFIQEKYSLLLTVQNSHFV